MYLVTWEDEDGIWLDDPEGCDTIAEAKLFAAKYPARKGGYVSIYSCSLIETNEQSPQASEEANG